MESLDMPQMTGDDFNLPDFDASNLENPSFDGENSEGQDFELEAFQNVPETEAVEGESHASEFNDFSDFDLVPPEVPQETKRKSVSFGTGKGKKEEVLSTELTDEQYKTFLQNLSYYPLNLRLALEEMIVGNEFNDDVIMDVIHKVIKRIPARQLATQVEKLMHRSIPVPLNYEKRTVAEYEIYRQSFEYKLKNKILPYTLAGIIVVSFCILLGF
jgi:hypothetical protein